jgi:phospholipase/lecithinase/hemolysin
MRRFTAYLLAIVACGIFATPAVRAADKPPAYDRVYVFGDSYSDIGAGYLDGNGPTAVAYLAERLGLKLVPSTAPDANGGSLDFAVSGAQTGSGKGFKVEDAFIGFGMHNQVEDFASRVSTHAVSFKPETTLFFLAGGLNDGNLTSETTVANLEGEIRALYGLGGRRFAVALMPTAIPNFSAVGKRLNPELARIPSAMMQELHGAQVYLSHWGPFFDEVMLHPAQYGIENTTQACAGRKIFHEDATPCAAPQAYFYYHKGHPSTAVHKVVGDMLYNEISGDGTPAPGAKFGAK